MSVARIAAIDGFRAMAMLLVVGFHSWEFSGRPRWSISVAGWSVDLLSFLKGNSRVDLFIVLSGFCLFLPLVKSPQALQNWDWRAYFGRRARRILPAYYAALVYAMLLPIVLVGLMRLLGRHADWQPLPSVLDVVTHVFFTHTLFRQTWDSLNGSLWTMGLEVHFYLAFPVLVLGVRRFGMRAVAVAAGVSLVYRVLVAGWMRGQEWEASFLASTFFLGRWMQFAMGMATAWLVIRRLQAGRLLTPAWGTAGVLAAISLHILGVSDFVSRLSSEHAMLTASRDLVLGCAFSLLVGSVCLSRTPLRGLFENRLASGLGLVSYSLFLVHQPTVYYVSQLMLKVLGFREGLQFFALLLAFGLASTLAVGLPLFYVFERPYLLRKR